MSNAQKEDYRIYTTKFDAVVAADRLDSVIGPLTPKNRALVDEAWDALQMGLLPWKTKAHIVASEQSEALRRGYSKDVLEGVVVSLLIDQSGSMRGQKMLFVAAAVDVVQEFLVTLGIRCEILGFTTSRWQGGRSRSRWKWRFRPSNPGRLNDLLHIVYQDAADARASSGRYCLKNMLRPDLPKENVDGEAIEWAAGRLRSLDQRHKLLIVLSDGAPVDDSTLMENGNTYLRDHLHAVVTDLNNQTEIDLGSFGIGYAPHDCYSVSDYVEAPSDLGTNLIEFLGKMITRTLELQP